MPDYQSTFEPPFDFAKPMGFPADMGDHIDPSNLLSSYQPSDAEWLSKDPFDILPWDMSSIDQTFNPFAEGAGLIELEPRSSYATSNHGSPTEFGGYSIKTEDALSDASPLSDAESETWSPSHSNDNKSGSQSPIDALSRNSRKHYRSDMPPTLRHKPSSATRKTNINTRNSSNDSASSPSSSPASTIASLKLTTSSKMINNKSARSTSTPHDTDAAAVMKRKKAAHNAIEKRYRTNMNAKFLALGNAIPRSGVFNGTQLASNKGPRKNSLGHARENLPVAGRRQQEQQQQQNKSEILTSALTYINELQDENTRLKSELLVLKENLLPGGNMMWRR